MKKAKPEIVLLIDQQEKKPLEFPDDKVQVLHLVTGDYSIRYAGQDLRNRIAIERKSLPDLYQSIGRNRETFKREILRLAALERAAIVIEAGLSDVLYRPPPLSDVHPRSVVGSLFAWFAYYGIAPIFTGSRDLAAATVRKILIKFAEGKCNSHE